MTVTQGATKLTIGYGPGLSGAEKAQQKDRFDKLPTHLKEMLHQSGTKVWVGRRADETPGWDEFSRETGLKSTSKIGDGREVGTLSFYQGDRNELFISVHHPGGSVNVYTHELGHAVDYQIRGDGRLVSNDPDWIALHNEHIRDNPKINYYYRGGPTGKIAASGRKELFAEGFAVYNEMGLNGLINFVQGNRPAAEQMIEIWKRYGVLK